MNYPDEKHAIDLAIQVADQMVDNLFQNEPDTEETENTMQFVFDRLSDALLSLPKDELRDLAAALRTEKRRKGGIR